MLESPDFYDFWRRINERHRYPTKQEITASAEFGLNYGFIYPNESVFSYRHQYCELLLVGDLLSGHPVLAYHELPFGVFPVFDTGQSFQENAIGFYTAIVWHKYLKNEGFDPFFVGLTSEALGETSLEKCLSFLNDNEYPYIPPVKIYSLPFKDPYNVEVLWPSGSEALSVVARSVNDQNQPIWTTSIY